MKSIGATIAALCVVFQGSAFAQERLRALGADPAATAPDEFDAYVLSEVAKFQKIVKDAGIKPE